MLRQGLTRISTSVKPHVSVGMVANEYVAKVVVVPYEAAAHCANRSAAGVRVRR